MGARSTKIDYKKRDFIKQPLENEEVDILLKALPEENVINSLDSEDREKIVRAMSDQKVFNLKGDNIFDYYFTNNKEAIKMCMTNQFTRDGTPCPDEKFNRSSKSSSSFNSNFDDFLTSPLIEIVFPIGFITIASFG